MVCHLMLWLLSVCACCLLLVDTRTVSLPPRQPPQELVDDYSLGGKVPIEYMYVDDTLQGEATHFTFSNKMMEGYARQAKKMLTFFNQVNARAGVGEVKLAMDTLPVANLILPRLTKTQWIPYVLLYLQADYIIDKRVCVIGSMEPWLEQYLLELGAAEVVVVEYNMLTYEDHRITTIANSQFHDFYNPSVQNPYYHSFDVVISPSAFDHDGLGRYGDPLNPTADLEAMARLQHILKPEIGLIVLTVPIGPDVVVFNLHRRYGKLRLPLLLKGYEVVARVGWDESKLEETANWRQTYEPVILLKTSGTTEVLKKDTSKDTAEDVKHTDL